MIERPGLEQIDGSGATRGQVPVWNPDSGGVWEPGTVGGSGPAREFWVRDYGAVGDGTTDDTTAILAAIDACAAAGGGTVTFEAKTYLCNGSLDTSRHGYAVIPLPTGRAPIRLRGVSPANNCDVLNDTGRYTIIKTTKTGLTRSGTYGVPSLIGGPTDGTNWAETTVSIENIAFHLPHNPTIAGVDLRYVRRMVWDGSSVTAKNAGDTDFVQPTSVYAFGLRTPENQNYNTVLIRNGSCGGMYVGLAGSVESLTLNYWSSKWCVIGWAPMTGGHGAAVEKLSTEWCTYHLSGWSETAGVTSLVTSPSGETKALLTISEWAIEDAAASLWYSTTAHINDSTNRLYGVVQYDRYATGTGVTSGLTVTGATNLTKIALLAPSFGSSYSLTVQDENSNVSTAVTQIDFQGAGVTATAGTGEVVVTIPGASSTTGELLMQDGVTNPPVPLTNEAGTDWLYQG